MSQQLLLKRQNRTKNLVITSEKMNQTALWLTDDSCLQFFKCIWPPLHGLGLFTDAFAVVLRRILDLVSDMTSAKKRR